MTFPLFTRGLFGNPTGLLIGTLIGAAFGFVLERAGFGRARNLVAQFYLTDLRVLKVMFSAIVTALGGMALLSGAGLLDISRVTVPETFLWPQLLGGLLLGAGFVISGYCPGTSVAAAASGNVDGVVAIAGMMAGSLAFGFGFASIEKFYESGARGVVRISDLLGLPIAVVTAAVVAMAVGAFTGGEKIERILSARSGQPAPDSPRAVKRLVFGGFGAAAVLALLLLAVPGRKAPPPRADVGSVDSLTLAGSLVTAPEELWVVDLRPAIVAAAGRIPGSVTLSAEDPTGSRIAALAPTRTLVVYTQSDGAALPAGVLRYPGKVMVLRGGFDAWQRELLAVPAIPESPAPSLLAQWRLRSALHSKFTGAAAVEPPKVGWKPAAPAASSSRKGGGC